MSKTLFGMKPILIALCLCPLLAPAQSAFREPARQTIYNPISPDGAKLDAAINGEWSKKFAFVDLRDATGYTPPKPVSGTLPSKAATESGERLSGYVLVAYIIADDGKAVEPVILKSDDDRLDRVALKAIEGWKFEPAKLRDLAIATTAAQEFHFQ